MLREGNPDAPETAPENPVLFNCAYAFASEIFLSASERKHAKRPNMKSGNPWAKP